MKLLLAAVLLLGLSVMASKEPDEIRIATECAKDNHVHRKEALDLIRNYYLKKKTHNMKCFVNCIFERTHILEKVKEKHAKEKHDCDSIKDADKCVESFEKFQCFVKIEMKVRRRSKRF
ncbi:general odorant-binding protein 56d [Drosophila teissieri]|uniref:general odorant-binding protein 56d n=1 Tax=Drosophila teissieri TaxID=7243 RepID=UPI001CB9E163|nr:general odorant-binding protein 56d [Drosophila teissieri]